LSKLATKRPKKRSSRGLVAAVVVVLLLSGALLYLSRQDAAALQRVPVDHVCMVNDKYFADPQIPVLVGTKTYFGCCEMCKGRLTSDAGIRTAIDPVSGNAVDKADAVIGALASGKVFYFENEQNLAEYQGKASR
jgi:YHS domain-containing protein